MKPIRKRQHGEGLVGRRTSTAIVTARGKQDAVGPLGQGDFNWDGEVTLGDLGILDENFGPENGPIQTEFEAAVLMFAWLAEFLGLAPPPPLRQLDLWHQLDGLDPQGEHRASISGSQSRPWRFNQCKKLLARFAVI